MSSFLSLFSQYFEVIDDNTIKDRKTGEVITRTNQNE